MTYGWAILIIAVVLGALFQLGVFNSSSFSPRAPPGACQVFRPSGQRTNTNINLMGVCTGQLPQYVANFNGASSYVSLPSSVAVTSNQITIAVWADELEHHQTYFALMVSQGNTWVDVCYGSGTGPVFQAYTGVPSPPWAYDPPCAPLGTWKYYVATYDGVATKLYVNGVAMTHSASISGNLANEPVVIGAYGNSPNQYSFNGFIANVQIYNASLTANQVQALYLEGIGGAPMKLQNLIGWWPLNGNSNDYSGNNNNGVPTAVTFTSQYGK